MKTYNQIWSEGFACGIALALAELVRLHGEDSIAADILNHTGMADEVARYADSYDYQALKLAEPSLRRPKGKVKAEAGR